MSQWTDGRWGEQRGSSQTQSVTVQRSLTTANFWPETLFSHDWYNNTDLCPNTPHATKYIQHKRTVDSVSENSFILIPESIFNFSGNNTRWQDLSPHHFHIIYSAVHCGVHTVYSPGIKLATMLLRAQCDSVFQTNKTKQKTLKTWMMWKKSIISVRKKRRRAVKWASVISHSFLRP